MLARLTDKDAKLACAFAQDVAAECRESNRFYPYLDDLVALLGHKNSLVRNRVISILTQMARWDVENRYETLIETFAVHVTDEKPITARQCISSLPEIAAAKPNLIPRIQEVLEHADPACYNESMRPLIQKDIDGALQKIKTEKGKRQGEKPCRYESL